MYNPNRFPSGYDELKSFYPVYYFDFDVFEMIELLKTYSRLSDDMEINIDTVINNQFIERADEPTITQLENFLWIPIDRTKSLNDRKHLVLSFFLGSGKLSASKIRQIIQVFTDGEIKIAFVEGTLEITVTRELSSQFSFADCLYILRKKIPAHLHLAPKDVFLPIRLINKRKSIFYMLGLQSQFFNRKRNNIISLDGLRDWEYSAIALQNVAFRACFNGSSINMLLLDGRRKLDGSWFLGYTDLETEQNRVRNVGIKFGIALTPKNERTQMRTFGFCMRFFNSGIVPPIALGDQSTSNGSWLLNQRLRGLVFPLFGTCVSAAAQGRVNSLCMEILAGSLSNDSLGYLTAFGTVQSNRNKLATKHKSLCLALYGAKQTYALSGSLKRDSMYRLDGSTCLDGTRKLNAQIIKEEM